MPGIVFKSPPMVRAEPAPRKDAGVPLASEIHACAGGHGRSGLLLRLFGHHGLGGDE
jgi:hypothetical protein